MFLYSCPVHLLPQTCSKYVVCGTASTCPPASRGEWEGCLGACSPQGMFLGVVFWSYLRLFLCTYARHRLNALSQESWLHCTEPSLVQSCIIQIEVPCYNVLFLWCSLANTKFSELIFAIVKPCFLWLRKISGNLSNVLLASIYFEVFSKNPGSNGLIFLFS